MAYNTTLAAISVACLMSTAIAASAATQESAPMIFHFETLKWNPTPFPGVTASLIAGDLKASGMYVMLVKYSAGGKVLPHTHSDQRIVTRGHRI
jgi:hypothetical protein